MSTELTPERRLLAANIRRSEGRIDLGLAALLIAREEYPKLVIEDYLERLDQLAAGLAVEIDLDGGAEAIARTIGSYLALEQGFAGDSEDYYNPRNSYLNEVMDSRVGIPISLSVLYFEVTRRVNVDLALVSMPGHFLLKLPARSHPGALAGQEVFLDPFHGGRVIDSIGARQLFDALYQDRLEFREAMLGAATKRQVLSRMLHNLKAAYVQLEDHERALRTVELLTMIAPWDLDEVRDRGLLRFRLGRTQDALPDLEAYARYAPPGPDVETVRDTLRRIGR